MTEDFGPAKFFRVPKISTSNSSMSVPAKTVRPVADCPARTSSMGKKLSAQRKPTNKRWSASRRNNEHSTRGPPNRYPNEKPHGQGQDGDPPTIGWALKLPAPGFEMLGVDPGPTSGSVTQTKPRRGLRPSTTSLEQSMDRIPVLRLRRRSLEAVRDLDASVAQTGFVHAQQ